MLENVKGIFKNIVLVVVIYFFLDSTKFLFFNTNSIQMNDIAIANGSIFLGWILLSCTYVVIRNISQLIKGNIDEEIPMRYKIKKISISILIFLISHFIFSIMENFFFKLSDVSYVKEICNAGTYLGSIIVTCTYIIVSSIKEIKS